MKRLEGRTHSQWNTKKSGVAVLCVQVVVLVSDVLLAIFFSFVDNLR